ncbi:hypothetical protein RMATCC62417_17498 [Rhizopus microsporus]|nr:hypothetical protein RMATCC62417_17498 [Rhizopus microsporus]
MAVFYDCFLRFAQLELFRIFIRYTNHDENSCFNYTGDRSTNPRGNVVHRWLKEKDIIVWNRQLVFGQLTFLTHKGNSIINLFMSTTKLNEPEIRIFTDKSLGSNYKMISFSFKTIALYQPTQVQRVIWNLGKLREQKVRDAYTQQVQSALTRLELSTQSVSHRFDNVKTAQRRIEELNHSICQIIYDSLDATCGQITSSYILFPESKIACDRK